VCVGGVRLLALRVLLSRSLCLDWEILKELIITPIYYFVSGFFDVKIKDTKIRHLSSLSSISLTNPTAVFF
jgi:hypothetical protein